MQWFLISIKGPQYIDGVAGFIDGEGDEVRKSLHGFTPNVPVTGGGGDGKISDAIKVFSDQVSK